MSGTGGLGTIEDLLPHARAEKEKGHVRLEGQKEVKNL
jgi:hypothetical protein